MKLLIVTQKVDKDDPILGFFHRWIEEFAKHFERVTVIGLNVGTYDLPKNVEVFSLGKESGVSKIGQFSRFFRLSWSYRHEYDRVFVHMNPIYIALCGWLWKLLGKRISLWYTHKQVDAKLRLAEKFADVIFTAAKESFNLKTLKVKVVGHGIDTNAFTCPVYEKSFDEIILLQVGRITPIKHTEEAVLALALLGSNYRLRFIGGPATKDDEAYFKRVKELVREKGLMSRVEFLGDMPNHKIKDEYCRTDLTLNLLPIGGLDKVVFESMASGRLVLTSNQAFREYMEPYANELILKDFKPETVARGIGGLFECQNLPQIASKLKSTAEERASVTSLIKNLSKIIYG